MVDRLFSEPALAEWYDTFCGWDQRDDLEFYPPMVMMADRVLHVGCGTGLLLRRAREHGHTGRLCGLDPAAAMLDVARQHPDIEWVLGDLGSTTWRDEFDLVVMTGHAFQVLLTDAKVRGALNAMHGALADRGAAAFETRNPAAREWERWTPDDPIEVVDGQGRIMRMEQRVESVQEDIVRFTLTYITPLWGREEVSESALRFLDAPTLDGFLEDAGFMIEQRFGDWNRGH